jgi:serine/threonine-protein kinase HipA
LGTQIRNRTLENYGERFLFKVAVSNCDDHLRVHGFLLALKVWHFSSTYDLNLNLHGMGLKLDIDEGSNALDIERVISTVEY